MSALEPSLVNKQRLLYLQAGRIMLSSKLKANMPSYKELLAQRQNLDAQIEAMRKSESQDALATVRQLISEFGLTQADIFPTGRAKSPLKGNTVAPKYRDPATGSTWTGRGKPPLWIAKQDRAQFEIK